MDRALQTLLEDPRVATAVDSVRRGDEGTLAAQIELSEIPAPPFGEDRRGRRMAALMTDAGLEGVRVDEVGNVLAEASRRRSGPDSDLLVVAAHLDTVFPAGTDVAVTRDGNLLRGPGISDDARGLATLLATARALQASGIGTRGRLLFAGTVGEEGVGDLRGVKRLFSEGGAGHRATAFISLDGAGLERVVVRGLGSRRFRLTARGPGGHSWVDWGTANPIHALSAVAQRLSALPLPEDPMTTLTIARWGGGKSINAIPQEAWLELDTRSEEDERLVWLESEVRSVVEDASRSSAGTLEFENETIGERPGGATPPECELVRATLAATRSQGCTPRLVSSSTDANIPMAKGIPAVTIGCGGEAGKAHTTEEWYRNVNGVEGVLRALYTILLMSGIED